MNLVSSTPDPAERLLASAKSATILAQASASEAYRGLAQLGRLSPDAAAALSVVHCYGESILVLLREVEQGARVGAFRG